MSPVMAHIGTDADGVIMLGLPVLLFGVFTLLERRARKQEQKNSEPGAAEDST